MSGSREYPGTFDEVINSPPTERQRKPRVNGSGDGGDQTISPVDFYAYMPTHRYIFTPCRQLWPARSVNARLGSVEGIAANVWLDQNRHVEQMTWAPGEPMLIEDRLISEGGWIVKPGCRTFNLYRPPNLRLGDSKRIEPWLNHLHCIYPDDAEHIINWLAHRVQRSAEKINHALLLGGSQGIGKDTLLDPVKYAIGPWNFTEVSPMHMVGRFNGFVRSVILRVSEARDLGDVNRFAFYEHMKTYLAAPPDVLRCDEKNLREYSVPNICGVIITTNHKTDGIYLPADDRRHYVAWSDATKENFAPDYWTSLYRWYEDEGYRNVTAYLMQIDLSGFNAKAPPRTTAAFHAIVDANRAPEDAELADTLDEIAKRGRPVTAVTIAMLVAAATDEFRSWLLDRKNRRVIPYRLESAGYVHVRNDGAQDGLWKIHGKRQVIYARNDVSAADRLKAVRQIVGDGQ
jgi:Family of unknown function (DUF5906)